MIARSSSPRLRRLIGFVASALVVGAAPAAAQWIRLPVPGTPRTADGKPNLSASVPKTADGKIDLTGIWVVASNKYLPNIAADGVEVPFRPEAEALYKRRRETNGVGRPTEQCLPHAVPDAALVGYPFKIVQTPAVLVFLFEPFIDYRQIHTDGRALPKDPQPTWMGYSVGRWEGETLVADTTGFNDRTWLDDGGHPHSDALRVTERFRRKDFGHMDLQITIDDPKMYTKAWTVNVPYNLVPDTELIEYVCENERDLPHMVGK
jgi:hypothetical protein